jgi:hypothetical protein
MIAEIRFKLESEDALNPYIYIFDLQKIALSIAFATPLEIIGELPE